MAWSLDQNIQPPGVGKRLPIDQPLPKKQVATETEDSYWLRLSRSAYDASTQYIDSNYRKQWENSIRAFHNQHSLDSKYVNPNYEKRSRIFRPKTRSVIRKNEAAACQAYFSNSDVMNLEAMDQSSAEARANRDVMKQLIQYRLTTPGRGVPWFHVVQGGYQEAQKVGVVAAHIYWKYREKDDTVIEDRPYAEIVPIENLRFDLAADWTNPVETSPYLIHCIPMHLQDVRFRMENADKKTGTPKWKKYPDAVIASYVNASLDSTRQARNDTREDPLDSEPKDINDYLIVWVQRHIHSVDGEDVEWYTLGCEYMLSDPAPLSDTVLHGRRPYVLGACMLEAANCMPGGVPELLKELQDEANELANQRLDNLKFVLNKGWFVRSGSNVDTASLLRNVPGRITMVTDLEKDVKEVNWPDVTGSSYVEQDRLNADIDELAGNFSASSMTTNPQVSNNAPVRNMQMLASPSSALTEYSLRTFTETFVQPVLRHVMLLEQAYETDEVIFALAAKKAKAFQRYGVNPSMDQVLAQELTLTVNVGSGATDPMMKLQRLVAVLNAYVGVVKQQIPGLNTDEIGAELFGFAGYQNGRRFFFDDDPQKQQMGMQIKRLMMMLAQAQMQIKEKATGHAAKLAGTQDTNKTKIAVTRIHEENENKRAMATHIRALQEAHATRAFDLQSSLMQRSAGGGGGVDNRPQ